MVCDYGFLQFGGNFCTSNVSAHQSGYRGVVDVVDHFIEEFHTLDFEHDERILLFVRYVANRVLEFIEETEIFFPRVVDVVEKNEFFKLAHHALCFAFVGFLEIYAHVVNQTSIADGNQDVVVHFSLGLVDLLNHREGY